MSLRALLALSILLSLACATADKEDAAIDGDTEDTDAPAAFEGDDGGECGDGADNDRNGYFACDDADCGASPDCETEEPDGTRWIWGDVTGEFAPGEEEGIPCVGEFEIEVEPSGEASGTATCTFEGGLGAAEGEVTGALDGTVFTGWWEASFAWYAFAAELEGETRGEAFTADYAVEVEGGVIRGTFTGAVE
ncbi:MAG: hypothetical protein ACK4YP_14320 [Myxococcota bacterium]